MGVIFLLLLVVLSALSGVLPWRLRGRGVMAFYLFVLPAGVASLFVIIQCSPSPANSIGQAIECLLALLAFCLSVTLPVSLLVMQKSIRHAVRSGRALWMALGAVAGFFLIRGLLDCGGSFPFSRLGMKVVELYGGFSFARIQVVVGIVLALLTLLGFFLRWGPTVPCTFLGIIAVKLFLLLFGPASGSAYEVAVAYRFAIQEDIGVILFGAFVGIAVGLVLDLRRTDAPTWSFRFPMSNPRHDPRQHEAGR